MGPNSDALVQRLSAELASSSGWTELCRRGAVQVTKKPAKDGQCLVRLSISAKLPVKDAAAVFRPEAMFGAGPRFFGDVVQAAEVVRIFGAGDMLGRLQPVRSGVALIRAMLLRRSVKHRWGDFFGRFVVRRDIPSLGSVTVLIVPFDMERYELCETLVGHSAEALVFEPQESGKQTRISQVVKTPIKNLWFLPMVPRWTLLEQMEDKITAHHHEATSAWGFLVLRIRKCCRGPPLVPSRWPATPEVEWTSCADPDCPEFRFSCFLRRALQALGYSDQGVFDELDGGRLVFYQAAVRRAVWEQVRVRVDALMLELRSAYRRTYGGSGAPYLEVDIEPRFCGMSPAGWHENPASPAAQDSGELVPEEEGAEADDWPWRQIPVRRTFVDFPCNTSVSERLSEP